MGFIKKHIKLILLSSGLTSLLFIMLFAAVIFFFMAAAAVVSDSETAASEIDGALADGLPDSLTYEEIEYCVYIACEKGIPASILLGQIALNKETAEMSNDVFLMGKNYENVREAISEYAEFITTGTFAELLLCETNEEWAEGLYTLGAVQSGEYPERLMSLINSYNLGRFDGLTLEGLEKALSEGSGIANGKFTWPLPVKGVLTSPFGNRYHPVYGYSRNHTGQDIAADQGTAILAADGGVVDFSGWLNNDGGYTVIISHGNNLKTMYCHIMEGGLLVTKGQKVSQGQQIARVGSTGASTGSHLHFSVLVGGSYVDPMDYVMQPY